MAPTPFQSTIESAPLGGRRRFLGDSGLLVPEDDLQRIHETSVRILSETGIKTDHPSMCDRLTARGCQAKAGRMLLSPEIIAATIDQIPSAFTLYGRSTRDSIEVSLREVHGTNTGVFPNIYGFDSRSVRRSTLEDVKTSTRLLDAMENVHVVFVSLVDATEMAPHMVTVADFAAVLVNTAKPLIGPGLTNRAEAEAVVAMALSLRNGSKEELGRFPICAPFVCSLSPLRFPKDIVEALIVVAEAGLPLTALANPVMGLTSPYTISGTVALGHAEMLALAVMAHAISPGLPILNQNTPSVADMRSLASTTGGPETGMMRQTAMSLSRYLQVPGFAHGHTSSARLDFQAGEEKALNSLLIAIARPALLGGLGGLANVMVTSYETILLDNERYGAIFRILSGVRVDKDHLGFDVIAESGDTGGFLASEHTLDHLRSNEVWSPELAVRQGLVGGAPVSDTSLERAHARAQSLIETHRVEPLPGSIQLEVNRILESYDHARAAQLRKAS